MAENQTHSNFYGFPCYPPEFDEEDPFKNEGA